MRSIVAAILVLSGLGVAGWVVADDTGDDIGQVSVAADPLPAADDATATTPPPGDTTTDAPEADVAREAGPGLLDRATEAPARTTRTTPTRSPAADAPDIERSSARLADVTAVALPEPTRIQLPSIGIDTAVVPVGVDEDGQMTVPEDVATVGWYRWGATTADDGGTIVAAGHVDSREQGRGAFFDLRVMEVGDEVTVTDADGERTTWRVTGRRSFDKESLPIEELYRRNGPLRLVLITCGGDFDAATRNYRSNIVVEAEPVA